MSDRNKPGTHPALAGPQFVAANRVLAHLDITSKTLRTLARRGDVATITLPTGGVRYSATDVARITGN